MALAILAMEEGAMAAAVKVTVVKGAAVMDMGEREVGGVVVMVVVHWGWAK